LLLCCSGHSAGRRGHDPATPFPPPWDIEEHDRSCFIVRDNNAQALAYVYFETKPGRRTAANLLTRDEARRGGNFEQVGIDGDGGAALPPPELDAALDPDTAPDP
jgi:hypothetical protein